jgi:hypothetical protein
MSTGLRTHQATGKTPSAKRGLSSESDRGKWRSGQIFLRDVQISIGKQQAKVVDRPPRIRSCLQDSVTRGRPKQSRIRRVARHGSRILKPERLHQFYPEPKLLATPHRSYSTILRPHQQQPRIADPRADVPRPNPTECNHLPLLKVPTLSARRRRLLCSRDLKEITHDLLQPLPHLQFDQRHLHHKHFLRVHLQRPRDE